MVETTGSLSQGQAVIEVDLVSDTVSQPSRGMREAMAEAVVGDEQRGEDPSVHELTSLVADMLGKQAAVLVPSTTMANQLALGAACRPGEEILAETRAHVLTSEAGAPAALHGAMVRAIHGDDGVFTAEQLHAHARSGNMKTARSAVVAVENTVNRGGGRCWPPEVLRGVAETARDNGMRSHLDGARLCNAAIATQTTPRQLAQGYDTVSFDLSKGLGAPVGAVLAGSHSTIEYAWLLKNRWGGAMRQSGILAAAGVYALNNNLERIADDHANARLFADLLRSVPGVDVEPGLVETNIVLFRLSGGRDPQVFVDQLLAETGVRVGVMDNKIRAVTHLDISTEDIHNAAAGIRTVLAAGRRIA